jgi:hypothetical protein
MAINLKNPDAVAAVKRLAGHYGTSYGRAIELAAEVALATPDDAGLELALAQTERIARAYAASLAPGETLETDDLYDQNGLYR